MKLLDWFLGGANYKIKRKGKIGEIIFPAYNGTNGWFKKSRWDLIKKVNKEGEIILTACIWNFEVVRAIELMQEVYDLKLRGKK